MSAEEKEPYFDGPLTTPNTGLQNYNPDNIQEFRHQGDVNIHEGAAAAIFYNPNNFGGAVEQNPNQPQIWQNMNNSNGGILQVAVNGENEASFQDYAGAAEAQQVNAETSSGASSQTSPVHQLKQTDFARRISNDQSNEQSLNQELPTESLNNEYNELNLQNDVNVVEYPIQDQSSSGAIPKSSHSGFVLDPSAFPPLNTESSSSLQPTFSNESMQNYLTPEHGIHQAGALPNDPENHMLQNPALNLRNEGLFPTSQSPDKDESYMNMAHSASGGAINVQQPDLPPQMVDSSALREHHSLYPGGQPLSGHDYDILHSQGTQQQSNHIFNPFPHQHIADGYPYQGMLADSPNELAGQVERLNLDPENNENLSMHGSSNHLENFQSIPNVATSEQGGFLAGENPPLGENLGIPQEIQTTPVLINSQQVSSVHQEDGGFDEGNIENVTEQYSTMQHEQVTIGHIEASQGDMNVENIENPPAVTINQDQAVASNSADLHFYTVTSPSESGLKDSIPPGDSQSLNDADLHRQEENIENPDVQNTLEASGVPAQPLDSRIRSQSIGSSHSNASSHISASQQQILSKSSTAPLPTTNSVSTSKEENAQADVPIVKSVPKTETTNPVVSNPFSTDMMHSSHPQTSETQSSVTPMFNPLQPPTVQQSLTPSQPPIPTVSNNQMLHSQMPTVRQQTRSNSSSRSNSMQNVNPLVPSTQSTVNPLAVSSSQNVSEPENKNNFVNVTSTPQVASVVSNNLSVDESTLGQRMSDPYLSRGSYQHQNQQTVSSSISKPSTYSQSQAMGTFVTQSKPYESTNPQSQASTSTSPPSITTYQPNNQNPFPVSYDSQSQQQQQPTYNQSQHGVPPHSNQPTENQQFVNQELRPDQRPSRPHSREPGYNDQRPYRPTDQYSSYERNQRFDPHNRYDDRRDREPYQRPSSRQSQYYDDSYHRDSYDRGYNRDYDEYRRREHEYYNRHYGYDSRERGYHRDYYDRNYDHQRYSRDPYYHQYDRSRVEDRRDDYYDYNRYYDDDRQSMYAESYYKDRHPDSARSGYDDRAYYPQSDYRDYNSSQYGDQAMDDSVYSNDLSWQNLPQPQQVAQRQTPAKFMSTHVIARFSAGGHLIKVLPHRPSDNQATTVEIHSVEILLQSTKEAENLRSYPGPLSKEETHKNDVLQFATQRATEALDNIELMDRQSTALLWNFLMLLVRQNGSVLGTDIAELLMKDSSGDFHFMKSPHETSGRRSAEVAPAPTVEGQSISSGGDGQSDHLAVDTATNVHIRHTHRFRELLLCGRRKDALEWAMKSDLWGHALLLASKTDARTHAQVMLRFANSLPINDPLQTVYQLMSGRQPAAATCVSEEGWGDWRPHLAMMLSNPTSSASLDMRAVLTMGDTLAGRGLLHAAHFCYLMASAPLGYFAKASTKLVLLGANHMSPFKSFATWDSIRRTEIYEYAISLGKGHQHASTSSALPTFQLFKFMYACNLAEYGLITQALHYCERIAKSIIARPNNYSVVLTEQLIQLSDRLKNHDTISQMDPAALRWLENIKDVFSRLKGGDITAATPSLLNPSRTASRSSPSTNDDIRFTAQVHSDGFVTTSDSEEEVDGAVQPVSNDQATFEQQQQGYYQQQGIVPQQPVDAYSQQQANSKTFVSPPEATYNQQQQYAQQGQLYQQPQQQFGQQQQQFGQQQQQQLGQQPPLMQPTSQATDSQLMPPPAQPPTSFSMNQNDFHSMVNQSNPLANVAPPMSNVGGFYQNRSVPPTPDTPHSHTNDFYENFTKPTVAALKHSSRSRTVSQSSRHSHSSVTHPYQPSYHPSAIQEMPPKHRSRNTSEHSAGRRSRTTSERENKENIPKQEKKQEKKDDGVSKSSSWSLFGWLTKKKGSQVHLPDDTDKQIVWDNDKKKWVNLSGEDEDTTPVAPPPMDNVLDGGAPQFPMGNPGAPTQPMNPTAMGNATNNFNNQINNFSQPQPAGAIQTQSNASSQQNTAGPQKTMTANRFSLKNLGSSRSLYKNTFASIPAPKAPVPMDIMPSTAPPTGFMIPNAAPASSHDGAPSTNESQPSNPPSVPMFMPQAPNQSSASENTLQPHYNNNSTPMQDSSNNPAPSMFYNPNQFSGTGQQQILTQPFMQPGQNHGGQNYS